MGILLVYDVTSKKSFDNITNWLRNIEEHASEGVEKLLVGNKVCFFYKELSRKFLWYLKPDFQSDLEDKRVITEEEGQLLAVQHSIDFIEASALSGENVREAFLRMARRVKLKHEAKSAAATPSKHNSVKIEQSSIPGVSQGLNSKFSNCC